MSKRKKSSKREASSVAASTAPAPSNSELALDRLVSAFYEASSGCVRLSSSPLISRSTQDAFWTLSISLNATWQRFDGAWTRVIQKVGTSELDDLAAVATGAAVSAAAGLKQPSSESLLNAFSALGTMNDQASVMLDRALIPSI